MKRKHFLIELFNWGFLYSVWLKGVFFFPGLFLALVFTDIQKPLNQSWFAKWILKQVPNPFRHYCLSWYGYNSKYFPVVFWKKIMDVRPLNFYISYVSNKIKFRHTVYVYQGTGINPHEVACYVADKRDISPDWIIFTVEGISRGCVCRWKVKVKSNVSFRTFLLT